jgi:hypothetical protein
VIPVNLGITSHNSTSVSVKNNKQGRARQRLSWSCAGKDKMKRIVFQSLVIVLCLTMGLVTYGQVARRNTGATPPAAPANPKTAPAPPNSTATGGYLIQPNDVLSVFVYKYPELSRERVLVLPDGTISVPLIQEIPVAGLTSLQLKQKMEETLRVTWTYPMSQ